MINPKYMQSTRVSNSDQVHQNCNTNEKAGTLTHTCILHPTGWLVFGKGNKPIFILVMKLQFPLSSVHHFLLSLLQVPPGQLICSHETISRMNIDFGKQQHQSISHIELIFIVQVILSVHEIFPLGLGFVSRSWIVVGQLRMGKLDVLLFPKLVLSATLDVGNKRIEGNGIMVMERSVGEIGAKLEAAMAVVASGFLGGERD